MRFDVLDRNTPVFSSHFLEASAGTGKTFAIEHLAARLLIEADPPLSIEKILIVTFTRAATRELKMRIRRNLNRIARELKERNPSADYLQAICEKGEEAIQNALEKIEEALISYDQAQIYTLHSFCHHMLQEFAFEAGESFVFSDPDEKTYLGLLEQMIKEHCREKLTFPTYSSSQIGILLKSYRKDQKKMIAAFLRFLSSEKESPPSPCFYELHATFETALSLLPELSCEEWLAAIEKWKEAFKRMGNAVFTRQISSFSQILAKKKCTPAQFDSLLREKEFFLEKMDPSNLKVKIKIENFDFTLLEKIRMDLLPPIEKGRDPAQIFLRIARELQEKKEELFDKKGIFSPDALLHKVERALQSPLFIEQVRSQYKVAIVDEFQDTDPIQWKIFRTLFLTPSHAICLVGDPKQSIYAFRNADVYTYLSALETMGESTKKSLDTNYRSTQSLVNALNLLFSRAKGGWIPLPARNEMLTVPLMRAGLSQEIEEEKASIQFWLFSGKIGRGQKFPTAEMEQTQLFPSLASEIATLATDKKVPLDEIAILVKDRFQGKAVVDYLKKQGISAYFKRADALTHTAAYFSLKLLFAALFSPHDTSKLKAAVGTSLICFTDETLKSGLENPLLMRAKIKMQVLYNQLLENGFGSFFEALLSTAFQSEQTILEEILSRGELSLYLDLRKLAELLIEEETKRGLKGEEFLKFLEKIEIESHEEESRLKVALQEEKGSIAVMTTHMSKGLEFDTVFAIGISSRHKIPEYVSIQKEGRLIHTSFRDEDPLCKQALAEQDAEKMRQFYVACTRAKQRLYIPLPLEEENKTLLPGQASPVELFFTYLEEPKTSIEEILKTFSPHIDYRFLEPVSSTSIFSPFISSPILSSPVSLHLPSFQYPLLSFSSLVQKHTSIDSLKIYPNNLKSYEEDQKFAAEPRLPKTSFSDCLSIPEEASLSPHTLPLGADTGQLLHTVLEAIFAQGYHTTLDEKVLESLIEEHLCFSLLDTWRPILLPWIIALLTKDLGGFTLSQVPRNQLQQEMEFLFPCQIPNASHGLNIPQAMMKGFADLVFSWGGKYYLLDWKSNYLGASDEEYTQEKMREAMEQHGYFLQAAIYTEALKRFVKLFDNRSFSSCFGGAIYYFIRGKGVYHFLPQEGLIC